MDINDVANASILGFIVTNRIVNEKGDPIEFYDHQFMIEPLCDLSPNQVIKKCAQIGGSVTYTLKTLWAAKYRGWNIIYTFPTDSDVNEFVSSKTNKIIQANPQVFSGLQTDNIERKEIGDRFIFYKGTVSKTAAIMTSADLLIHDEADRSDQSTLETYKSRLKASKFKGRWIFSNPTTGKCVVDNEWQKSDKKEWHVTCKKCNFE
jgi:phage terminase large subunit GpA-like protein